VAGAQSTDAPVRLVVATDHEIRNDREWSRGLALVVAEAEDLLHPYLGRPLEVVRTAPWQGSIRQPSADSLLQDLMHSVSRGDADIVVGFVRSYSFQAFTETGARARGLANYRGAYAVLMLGGSLGDYRTPISEIGALLAHELAHVFGAVHRSGADLLLAPSGVGRKIDALSAALIGMNRERSFGVPGFPLPAHYREAARPLYRKAIEDDPGNLDARLMLARLDVETGRYEEAVIALEEILSEIPGSLEARADLDLALSLLHREAGSLALALGSARRNVGESPRLECFYQRKVGACS
jgi:tetratricopeptide (TPR) repeat protein